MVTLLQDREYRHALARDLLTTHHIRIECLTLTSFLTILLEDFLSAGGSADILCNAFSKKYLHTDEFLEVRKLLKELGASVYVYDAPHINHQKVVLIEPDIVYIGSHNMTVQSNFNNRETSLRIVHPDFYNKLLAGFKLKTIGTT